MPGPPPKPADQRRHRRPAPGTVFLPAEGRAGDPPEWPLGRSTAAERKLWGELWATPQAVAWERLGWTRMVGRYCRYLVAAERRDAATRLMAEVRQMEDRLGLTPMSMLRLRWEIVGDELAEQRGSRPVLERPRLRAVDPETAAGE